MQNELSVNIPLFKSLERIPNYAKFMKDKWQRRELPIIRVLVTYIIVVGLYLDHLYNLGARIHLIPLEVCILLGLIPPKPRIMWLLMDDHTVKKPLGISFDNLVKVENFFFLDNFVFMDFDMDFEMSIILGYNFIYG